MKKQKKIAIKFLKNLQNPKSQRSIKIGKAPGTVTYIGDRQGVKAGVSLIAYDDSELLKEKMEVSEKMDISPFPDKTQWFTIIGLSDEGSMRQLAGLSGLNPLVMEDIVNTESRPKVDEYDDHILVVLKMLYSNGSDKIVKEHIALVLKSGSIFVYQEIEDDVFDGVRSRLEQHHHTDLITSKTRPLHLQVVRLFRKKTGRQGLVKVQFARCDFADQARRRVRLSNKTLEIVGSLKD